MILDTNAITSLLSGSEGLHQILSARERHHFPVIVSGNTFMAWLHRRLVADWGCCLTVYSQVRRCWRSIGIPQNCMRTSGATFVSLVVRFLRTICGSPRFACSIESSLSAGQPR